MNNKVLLIILDGWGIAPSWGGNAISQASVDFYNQLLREFPNTILKASGRAVGLPGHEMGNSEVGHLTIGAGRIIPQDILIVNQAIENRSFFQNKTLIEAIERTKTGPSNLHLIGLVSDGSVHSHINHLIALLVLAYKRGASKVFIHAFTDGRDTDRMSAQLYLTRVINVIKKLGTGSIASVSGRYYAMDRNRHFERTQKVYEMLVLGKAMISPTPLKAVGSAYEANLTDEFIPPILIGSNKNLPPPISDGDNIIFFNFRADRARQLTQAFLRKDFRGFKREKTLRNLFFVTLVPYGTEIETKVKPIPAFTPIQLKNCLAEVISKAKLYQFYVAETEKYAHVTYFFNGANELPFPLEDREIITSLKVVTYDKAPEMSVAKIVRSAKKALGRGRYSFILVNFANPDMVGHTGNFLATIRACQTIDKELKVLVEEARRHNYFTIVTADHGNAEELIDPHTNQVDSEHTTNPVPFILIPPQYEKEVSFSLKEGRGLSDIAPTILEIMGVPKPPNMTGQSLLVTNYASKPQAQV